MRPMKNSLFCVVAALAATPAVAAAQQAAAPPSAKTSLGYMQGKWRVAALDPASGETSIVCYTVAPFVGDVWLSGHGWSAKLGFESKDVWGLDPRSGEVIRAVYDSSGVHAVVTSPGWSGDTLVLEGDARSSKGVTRVRETIERVGPDEFLATWEAKGGDEWSAYSIERATRLREGDCNA